MALNVIIADAEIVTAAQKLVVASERLQKQAERLGRCFVEVNTEDGIRSEATLARFQELCTQLEAVGKEIEGCTANLTANAQGFIDDVNAADNFMY